MRYLLDNVSPFFPMTLQSNKHTRGDSVLQAAIESENILNVEAILEYVTREQPQDKTQIPRVCKYSLFISLLLLLLL